MHKYFTVLWMCNYLYQDNGFGAEHFGAFKMIRTAPASIAIHRSQNITKITRRSFTQNGSDAYFINSSLVIPVKPCKIYLKNKMYKKIQYFCRLNFPFTNVNTHFINQLSPWLLE